MRLDGPVAVIVGRFAGIEASDEHAVLRRGDKSVVVARSQPRPIDAVTQR